MSKKVKRQNSEEEVNFWQPASDMFSALLLILMLVILLLGLYLVHIPDNSLSDPTAGNTFSDSDHDKDEDETQTVSPSPTLFFWYAGGGGGDNGDGGGFPTYGLDYEPTHTWTVSPSPTITPTPDLPGGGAAGGGGGTGGGEGVGEGPGEEPDQGMKSAVYVIMVDADTERSIKEAGVQFELYSDDRSLQVLNVYYPEHISFRLYETTEAGSFFFPEKLFLGGYELHELTEPAGYDASENIEFLLNETYDWSDPLVVRVPLYPSRNIVRVKMMDADTGMPLPGAEFDVIAADNIITSDGTLRYRSGQVVSEIICDENGMGQSEKLYLGEYLIRQRVIPEYYVGLAEDINATIEKNTGSLPPQNAIVSTRTKIAISLKDELYPTRGISGAVFSVQGMGSTEPAQQVATNKSGNILLDSLEKGMTYRITQVSSEQSYRMDETPYTFQVSADGRIDGEEQATLELFNHMVRVSIGITDEFSDIQVSDINLALYDSSDTLIRAWTTTGAPLIFDDLDPGSYYVIKDGDRSTRYDIQVRDDIEIQYINLQTSYLLKYIIIGSIAALILIIFVVVIIVIVRRRRKKRK